MERFLCAARQFKVDIIVALLVMTFSVTQVISIAPSASTFESTRSIQV